MADETSGLRVMQTAQLILEEQPDGGVSLYEDERIRERVSGSEAPSQGVQPPAEVLTRFNGVRSSWVTCRCVFATWIFGSDLLAG